LNEVESTNETILRSFRVASFFLTQCTKTGGNIPNCEKFPNCTSETIKGRPFQR
jgi:hypothetical protein